MKARTKISAADIIVCLVAVILAVILLFHSGSEEGNFVHVKTFDGSFSYELSRDRTETIYSAGHTLTLEIKDSAVRITESDCPDRLCVSAGWINDPSRLIVCAPAKVLVRIDGTGGDPNADFIAGR